MTETTPPPLRRVLWFPVLVMLAVSLLEIALADRKYGLFTGGFGQSRAVDTPAELALFALGYGLAQLLLGCLGWALSTRLARRRPAWAAWFLFAAFNGVGFVFALASLYQLHAYFSDAMSFALMKQLGGGSLGDALLFSLSEILLGAGALVGLVVAAWLGWRIAHRVLPQGQPAPVARWRWTVLAALGVVAAAWAVPRSATDTPYGLARTLAWAGASVLLDLASDVDRDGYGAFAVQHDDAPFDPARHPLALDLPGNGIDEDGYGGDLAIVPMATPLPAQRLSGSAPNLVVVVLESTRGDVLGKRIGGKPVAPNLEAIAREGGAVRPVYSHVGFTTESLKSLFSGQLAPRAGDPSLFRDLKASGYDIGVFSGQPEDFGGISETVGMRAAADVYVDAETLKDQRAFDFAAQGSLLVDEGHLLAAYDRTVGKAAWTAPQFLYFNFQSAHFPYWHEGVAPRLIAHPLERGQIAAERRDAVAATYWNAVAHADAALGQLVARLKAKGVWDNTLLLVVGDHGEDLFEDGFLGHGHVINPRQFATMLVASRKGVLPPGPLALSDIRAIALAGLRGAPPPRGFAAPFQHIGPLDTPTAIGLAGPGGRLTSLRLDTGMACFLEQTRCQPYEGLRGAAKARVDAVVARWGSERLRERARDRGVAMR